MIQKEHIWDLVAAKSYHSCVITTYSFDFFYFEKSVMRILRSKGIGNISIFVDQGIFQGILGKIGNSSARAYAINAITSKGCFHPKIYMFFGEKQGLLIIGSGNLTSSGHGKNDEIWGAFHFDVSTKKHAQLFANAWTYLEGFSKNIKGFGQEKIRWISAYTPWLETLPTSNTARFEKLDQATQVAFLYNAANTTIFQQLRTLIPFEEVKKLTIVAPYFDTKGKIIELFFKQLPNATIQVLIDDQNGILPLELTPEIANQIHFYHWKDCFSNTDMRTKTSRLHAKLFNFVLNDGTKYCMLGSANASVAGLGTDTIFAINEEASMLLKTEKTNYLKELGIKIKPKKRHYLTDFESGLGEASVLEKPKAFRYLLEAIDKEGDVLNVYINIEIESTVELHLFNTLGEKIHSGILTKRNENYCVNIPNTLQNLMYGCLVVTQSLEIVSNKQIIQDVHILAKTNPDPQKRYLDILFSHIEHGDEAMFSELISAISPNIFTAENKVAATHTKMQKQHDEAQQNDTFTNESLSYEEFKTVSYDAMQQKYAVLHSNSYRIADFLTSFLHAKTKQEIPTAANDDEELDVKVTDREGRENQTASKTITKSKFKQEKRKITNFFKTYNNHLATRVAELIAKSNQQKATKNTITIDELSNFIVALITAIYYTDRERIYTKDTKSYKGRMITSFGFESYDHLPIINTEIIGKFLLLCTKDFEVYKHDYLNQRLKELKRDAFFHVIFCLELAKWHPSEEKYHELLLLNAMYFLKPPLEVIADVSQFTKEMNLRYKFLANNDLVQMPDIKKIMNYILPKYLKFTENMALPKGQRKMRASYDLMRNDIVFTSRLGFCNVHSKTKQEEGTIVILSRPGFPWGEKQKAYILEEKRTYKKNIVW